MSRTAEAPTSPGRKEALVGRILDSARATFETYAFHLGDRLGYYAALRDHGPLTSADLAAHTVTAERYAREWLEQQAVTGVLEVVDEDADTLDREYRLPAEHAEVLVDRDSLDYLAPLARVTVGAVQPIETLLDVFRTGRGLPYEDYGQDLCLGQAGMNRAAFRELLGKEWLPSLPETHRRLQSDPPARIADIGCGAGWSSLAMAEAYPNVRVDGFDLDAASIREAERNARAAGLSDRVAFRCRDAGDPELAGEYQLVTAFECIHDVSRPVEVLAAMRRLCAEDGTVLVMDERVGERFRAGAEDVEKLFYGFSVFHCLPVGMTGRDPVGTGTVMRPGTLRAYAEAAGFSRVEVLGIENYFFRFYRLVP